MATILLASGNGRCIELLTAELEAEGHRVVAADTGHEAYESAIAELPELVFLDASLAVFDGLETCQMLRNDPAVPPKLPIYLLTDAPLDPRIVERTGLTGCISRVHDTQIVRDLLAAHAVNP
jgi:CheY-like chemotaxis protein